MILKSMKYKILFILLLFTPGLQAVQAGKPSPKFSECTSHFTWERVEGTNTSIQFQNESSGNFTNWLWDFGDGTTSGLFHPQHEFPYFGSYIVCLTVSNGSGYSDTFCDTVVIEPQCDANFSFSYVPTTPINVQFTDLSTGFPDTWLWDFGDGNTSTLQNPVHAYPVPGDYTVSLFIRHDDSLYTCFDTISKTVFIPDSMNCEAAFTYEISPEQAFEVAFTDHSSGNISNWEWDFGDGSISFQQNPLHQYEGPGEYLVCLNVFNADSMTYCFHFICKTILLNEPVNCQADFSVMADSGSHIMYHYTFINHSAGYTDKWKWDFGDGNYSQQQHPVHVYESPGTYMVCLEAWNNNYPGCTDTRCKLVKTAEYYQLGGLAFIGDNPINNPYPTGDTGIAILYRQRKDLSLLPVDTNRFHQLGYYWFNNMMEQPYVIWIGLTPASVHYRQFIPSYYSSAMSWQEADALVLNNNMYEINISMLAAGGAENGPGRIGGRVVHGNSPKQESHRSFHDIPVILTSAGNQPLEWTITNEYGQFEFISIALGEYKVIADMAGVYSFPETVVLSQDHPVNDTVRIEMYTESPLYVEKPLQDPVSLLEIYPNPVNNKLNLTLLSDISQKLQISIYNISGQRVYEEEALLNKGRQILQVPCGNLSSGLYWLSVHARGKTAAGKKFLKQ
jgi:PKD repeat protein